MRVGFNKGFAILMIVLAILDVVLSTMTGSTLTLISGAIVGLVGVVFFFGHGLEIADGEVRVKNAWGMTMKRHPIASPAELRTEGKKLFIGAERVKGAGGFMVDGGDWRKLEAWIAEHRATTGDDAAGAPTA